MQVQCQCNAMLMLVLCYVMNSAIDVEDRLPLACPAANMLYEP